MGLIWFGTKVEMRFELIPEQLTLNDENENVGITSLKFSVISYEEAKSTIEKGF